MSLCNIRSPPNTFQLAQVAWAIDTALVIQHAYRLQKVQNGCWPLEQLYRSPCNLTSLTGIPKRAELRTS